MLQNALSQTGNKVKKRVVRVNRHNGIVGLMLKIILKLYEMFLRVVRPATLEYFCHQFESRPQPEMLTSDATLSILIPYRDRWQDTEKCLDALVRQNMTRLRCKVHLIDNGSLPETQKYVERWLENSSSKHIEYFVHSDQGDFNFSRLCNIALNFPQQVDEKESVLFLNNDVILEDPQTLRAAIAFSRQTADCGALGITLLFPNRQIQHIFAAPGVKIVAGHPFKGKSAGILHQWNRQARQVPAVTGAFLLLSLATFHRIQGFDEQLPTTGQDIDLCLKLQAEGLKNWVLPYLQAIHVEGASRGRKDINRAEVDYIYEKWSSFLTNNPSYPSRISRWSEQPAFTLGEGAYPYHKLM